MHSHGPTHSFLSLSGRSRSAFDRVPPRTNPVVLSAPAYTYGRPDSRAFELAIAQLRHTCYNNYFTYSPA